MARRTLDHPVPITEVLPAVLRPFARLPQGEKDRLLCCWASAAGEAAVSHTRRVALRHGILMIDMDGQDWVQALRLFQGSLLTRLRAQPGLQGLRELRLVCSG